MGWGPMLKPGGALHVTCSTPPVFTRPANGQRKAANDERKAVNGQRKAPSGHLGQEVFCVWTINSLAILDQFFYYF